MHLIGIGINMFMYSKSSKIFEHRQTQTLADPYDLMPCRVWVTVDVISRPLRLD